MENFVLVKNDKIAVIGPCNGSVSDTLDHLQDAILGYDYGIQIIWGGIRETLKPERDLLIRLKIIVGIYNELAN